jgi:hypothetical protein
LTVARSTSVDLAAQRLGTCDDLIVATTAVIFLLV